MKRLGMILIAATMYWQQVTPTDQNGCAGFEPKNYDQPNLSSQSEVYTSPTESAPPNDDPNDSGQSHNENEDSDHDYGDNQGHGQFDEPSGQGGYSWE